MAKAKKGKKKGKLRTFKSDLERFHYEESVRRLVPSEQWYEAVVGKDKAEYPPLPSNVPPVPCQARRCRQRLYPQQYRTHEHRGKMLCEDCHEALIAAHARRWRRQEDGIDPDVCGSTASPSTVSFENLERSGGEVLEVPLASESTAVLQAQIDRYLARAAAKTTVAFSA